VTERIPSANGQPANGEAAGALPEPAAELVQTVMPAIPRAVDELHVAAVLESMGMTDQSAHDTYRHDDVFALADAVSRLMPAVTGPTPGDGLPAPARSGGTLRVLTHGLLYVLPTTVYPAVLIALGARAMIRGLMFSTALGWVWGMGMSAVAYQMIGHGRDRAAGRALRLLGLAGLVAALLTGIVLAATGPGGTGMVAFVVAQVNFQLMSGVLVFYRHEFRLAVTMLPASASGIALLLSRYASAFVAPTLAAGELSTLLLAVTAWETSRRAPVRPDSPGNITVSRTIAGAAPSIYYAALCATFMLLTDSRFLFGDIGLAIAALPLILGMGMLEWRAHRFTDKVGKLWSRSAVCAEFRRAAWRLLMKELASCLAVLGGLGAILLVILRESGALSSRDAMLVNAHVLLGGAFFLGFVLARHQQFGRLLGIMSFVVAADVLLLPWASVRLAPDGAIPIFLLCTAILLILQLITLRASFRRVFYYL
jgi:hypothetical protein